MDKYKIKKQIKEYKRQMAATPQEIYMTLDDVVDILQAIVDDYEKEPKKYRVRINDEDLPIPLYLCDVCSDDAFTSEHFLNYRVTTEKQYAATFTKEFIMDNFKNYLAIDWSKALEPAEDE